MGSLKFLWVLYLAMEGPAPSTTYRQGKGHGNEFLPGGMIDAAKALEYGCQTMWLKQDFNGPYV